MMTANGDGQTELNAEPKRRAAPGAKAKRDMDVTFYCQYQSQSYSFSESECRLPHPAVPVTVVQEIQICKISRGPGQTRPF